jgi:hypothetical protein
MVQAHKKEYNICSGSKHKKMKNNMNLFFFLGGDDALVRALRGGIMMMMDRKEDGKARNPQPKTKGGAYDTIQKFIRWE